MHTMYVLVMTSMLIVLGYFLISMYVSRNDCSHFLMFFTVQQTHNLYIDIV